MYIVMFEIYVGILVDVTEMCTVEVLPRGIFLKTTLLSF